MPHKSKRQNTNNRKNIQKGGFLGLLAGATLLPMLGKLLGGGALKSTNKRKTRR
tara:strand:+ start:4209 stop:4370 length:162 start_codon:yes stop_codon:yes gene_type:complete